MSIPSGVNNTPPSVQNFSITENPEVSTEETKKAKEAEKAQRMEAAQMPDAKGVSDAQLKEGDLAVTAYGMPTVHSDVEPDFAQAATFLDSPEYEQANQDLEQAFTFMTKIFTRAAEILIELKAALNDAKTGASELSSDMSDLGGKVTKALTDRMLSKADETFATQVSGAITGMALSGGALTHGTRVAGNARQESKAFHGNINSSREAGQGQRDAIRNMELEGKGGTREHMEAQSRLETHQQQESKMEQSHELHQNRAQQEQQTAFAAQQMSGQVGGIISGGSTLAEAAGQADMDSQQTTRDITRDMRDRANQSVREMEENVRSALDSFRQLQEANANMTGNVARNL